MFWGLKCQGEWGSDKGLCPLGSRDEGSFVAVKLDPPPFMVGVPLSWYTRIVHRSVILIYGVYRN